MEEVEEGHDMSTGQGAEDINLADDRANLKTTSQWLKCLRVPEKQIPRKKVKASKESIDLITLTECDLFDIGETVRNVTKDALQEVMMEQNTVLGALRA